MFRSSFEPQLKQKSSSIELTNMGQLKSLDLLLTNDVSHKTLDEA